MKAPIGGTESTDVIAGIEIYTLLRYTQRLIMVYQLGRV